MEEGGSSHWRLRHEPYDCLRPRATSAQRSLRSSSRRRSIGRLRPRSACSKESLSPGGHYLPGLCAVIIGVRRPVLGAGRAYVSVARSLARSSAGATEVVAASRVAAVPHTSLLHQALLCPAALYIWPEWHTTGSKPRASLGAVVRQPRSICAADVPPLCVSRVSASHTMCAGFSGAARSLAVPRAGDPSRWR